MHGHYVNVTSLKRGLVHGCTTKKSLHYVETTNIDRCALAASVLRCVTINVVLRIKVGQYDHLSTHWPMKIWLQGDLSPLTSHRRFAKTLCAACWCIQAV